MGQQQLLLIILGVIVVGIAVAVGITMFTDNAQSANRDAVVNDLVNLASRAQQFYRRPFALGGGQGSFVLITADAAGLAKLTSKPINADGTFSVSQAGTATQVVLRGIGTETGRDATNPINIEMYVLADSTWVDDATAN